jgi:hypothetical protein
MQWPKKGKKVKTPTSLHDSMESSSTTILQSPEKPVDPGPTRKELLALSNFRDTGILSNSEISGLWRGKRKKLINY